MQHRNLTPHFRMDWMTIAGCGLLAFGLAAPAWASSVLLPDDSSGAPNLGLAPAQNAKPATTAPATPAAATTQPQAAPQPAAQASSPTTATQQPQQAPPSVSAPASPKAFLPYTPVPSQKAANGGGAYKIPTMVIEAPETPDFSQLQELNLPQSATITLSEQSVWTNADITTITQKLGLTASKVTSVCRISLSGLIITDKTPGLVDSHGTTSTVARFDGKVRNIIIATRALCDTGTAPPEGAGVIQKIGNSFMIPLSSALCKTPANGQVGQIIITHGQGTMDECAVR